MADRSVVVRLRADISDFQRKMGEAAKGTKDAATGALAFVDKNAQSINTLSNGLGLVGAGMTGVAAIAVAKFADFDQAMSGVKSTGDDAAGSIDRLREAALELGADTVFSATEAANGIEEMAKAGVSAADILGGGLKGALDLAAAGELAVADAAGIAATVMNQFGLKGTDVTHIADVLAASAGKANGEVADFGLAMKYVGPVASQLGVSLEETSGTLALLAENGLLADSAGTGLRGVLMSLTAPTKAAQGAMEEYGISAFDAQGEFVGLTSLAGQLHTQLGSLTEAERSAALGRMFGNEQITTARILYAQGAEAIEEWTAAVDDSGYAAETAATKLDNLKGDWEAFTGSLDSALIGMGEGANGPLRMLVQQATKVTDAFGEMPAGVQQATLAIVGGGGLVLLGVAGMGKLAIATAESISAMKDLGLITDATGSKLGGVVGKVGKWAAGIGLVTAGLIALDAATNQADMGTEELASRLDKLSNSKDVVGDLFGDLVPKDSDLKRGEAFAGFLDEMANPGTWGKIGSNASDLGVSITRVFGDDTAKWSELKDRLAAVGTQISTLATSDLPAASAAFTALYEEAGGTQEVGENLLKTMPGLRDALIGIADGAGLATDDATLLSLILGEIKPVTEEAAGAQDEFGESTSGANSELATQAELLAETAEAHTTLMNIVLGERDAQRGFEAALDAASEALAKNGATLDITTEKGRANQAALDAISSSGAKLVEQMVANGASQEEISAAVERTRTEFISMATQMGMTGGDAEALADKLGLIPGDYTARVIADTDPARAAIDRFLAVARSQQIVIQARVNADPSYSPATAPSMIMRAEGGPVFGPGGETSDSIPALLSNNEHVWTAAEVRAAGGHGAVMGLRSAALSGRARFAEGGAVGTVRSVAYSAPAQAAVAAPSLDLTGLQLVGTLMVNGMEARMEAVAVGVVDARDRSDANTRQTVGRVR